MKYLRVTMPDGSKWDVPANVIADNRARSYSDSGTDVQEYRNEMDYALTHNDKLTDWADNNMNWSNVEPHAVKVQDPDADVDYQDGWCNGEKKIVEK